jgi:hypothetical protein
LGAVKLEWLSLKTYNVLVSRQGGILPGSWKLDSPSKKESKGKLIRGPLLLPRHPQVRRSSMRERAPFSPILSHHCHLWLRSWGRHLGTSGCSHPTGVTLIQFFCLFALRTGYLDLLYQLKAYIFKIALSMRGSKVTKRVCMARGRTSAEVWMGTPDKVDFCPLIYPVRQIYFL